MYILRKHDYFRNHVKGRLHEHDHAVYYLLTDTKDKINQYVIDLNLMLKDHINCQIETYSWIDGYVYLRIYASKKSKLEAIKMFIDEKNKEMVITVGSKLFDLELMRLDDFSMALKSADEEILKQVDYIIDSDHPDDVVKLMHKIYHTRDPKKFIERLKKAMKTS